MFTGTAVASGCSDSTGDAGSGGAPGAGGAAVGSGGSQASGGSSSHGGTSSVAGAGNGGATSAGSSSSGGLAGSSSGGASSSGGSNSGGMSSGGSASGGANSGGSNSGGASSGGSTASAGAAGSTSTSGFFSDDFESDTVGKQPAGWDNFIAWNLNGTNPSGTTLALVDSTHVHGGTKAVHFHGGSNPALLYKTLPANTKKLYLRAYFYMSRQLGQNPGANHETLLGIGVDKDNEVRFGEIKGVIGTNEIPTDDISPTMDQWGKGPVVAANKWVCMEVAFIGDQAQHELHAWADGTLVHEITSASQWQNHVITKPDWLTGKFVHALVGWHSFSSNEVDVWMDDIVLSNSRINCPAQ